MNPQYINIRHRRHDYTVAPHVRLARSRADLRLAPMVGRQTSAPIFAEGETARLGCDAELMSREDLLLRGSSEGLANLDARIELPPSIMVTLPASASWCGR